ncbi:Putative motility protein [Bradyrhizobium canariense]|uniref:Putative motility protein n=1 Tax=Bradyrhizobium canariense TaxID=255045 RepID=A0A1H1XD05_9BRAD|nr:Putative motility protein [Bradyrhizobium canariense]
MVAAALALQAGNTQTQIATSVMKSNLDAEKSSVETILGIPSAPSTANLGPGIGSNLNVTA